MRDFTGRESSAFALLAQSGSLTPKEIDTIVDSLEGEARWIALTILGRMKPTYEKYEKVAQHYLNWAKELEFR